MQRLFDRVGVVSCGLLAAVILCAMPLTVRAQDAIPVLNDTIPVLNESTPLEAVETPVVVPDAATPPPMDAPTMVVPTVVAPEVATPQEVVEPTAVDHGAVIEHGAEAVDTHGAEAAAGHASDHAAEHGSGGLPQLDVTTFTEQLFWLVVTFAILFVLFSKKTIPEISNVIEDRARHIGDNLKSAERLKNEAEEAKVAYEAALMGSRAQAAQMMSDVQNAVKTKAEEQARAFRARAEKEAEALDARLEKSRAGIMDEMSVIAAEVASEAAGKIVGTSPDIGAAQSIVKSIKVA